MGKRSDPGWRVRDHDGGGSVSCGERAVRGGAGAPGGVDDPSEPGPVDRSGAGLSGAARSARPGGPRESSDSAGATDVSDDGDSNGGRRKRRLDLNVPQVAGSAVAAVLAAKFASNLGVYGTILGAGVVSAVATCGGTVFQHFFRRSGEQIREAAGQLRPRARQAAVPLTSGGHPVPATFRAGRHTAGGGAPSGPLPAAATGATGTTHGVQATMALYSAAPGAESAARPAASPVTADPVSVSTEGSGGVQASGGLRARGADAYLPQPVADPGLFRDTAAAPPGAAPDATGAGQSGGAAIRDATRPSESYDDSVRLLPRVPRPTPEASPGASASGLPSQEYTEGTLHHARVRGLKRPVVAAALVFTVTMGGITAYELASGHSLSGGTGGTTIGDVFTGGHADTRHTPTTPATPTEQPTPDDSGASRGDGDGGATDGSGTGTDRTPQQTAPTPDPTATQGTGSGADQDGGQKSSGDADSGQDQQTPTPTPTPSSGTGTGSGADTDGDHPYSWQREGAPGE